jgi:hypothetical protein
VREGYFFALCSKPPNFLVAIHYLLFTTFHFPLPTFTCSGRWASFLQRDSTRLFQKLLRMFLNAFAFAQHPTD